MSTERPTPTLRQAVQEQRLEAIGCPRCGLSVCGCYGEDRRWPRWLRLAVKKWGVTKAEAEKRLFSMQLRGDLIDWHFRNVELREHEQWPNLPFWEGIRREYD